MNKIYFRVCWLIVLLMAPWLVQGAGLGKLTLGSSLGQPLKAEVELVSVGKDEIPSLAARVASPEAFHQAGMAYAPYHSSLIVSVEKRANGQPYIRITSPQSINEPFLNLLIELNGSSGRSLREYTVLLDLAETQLAESAMPVVQQVSNPLQTASEPSEAIQPKSSTGRKSRTNGLSAYRQKTGTYGPVVQGDTLTKIARRVLPEGIDLNQMLVALYQVNRDAFFEKNMNLLKVGAILRIPDQNEISSIDQEEANHEIKAQTANWQAYRQRIADAAMGSSPKTELKQSAAGRISTSIREKSSVAQKASPEVLILSKGEQLENLPSVENFDGGKAGTAQDYLRMMEEDTIAKDRALKEANERVALLEQNIERLQQLLEIKSTGMADAQSQAEQSLAQMDSALPPAPASVSSEAAPADTKDTVATYEMDHAEQPEMIAPAQPVISEQITNQEALPADSSEPIESTLPDQIIGFVTDNLELVGGVLAVLLTGWLGISLLRRRREKNDDMDDVFDYPEEARKDNTNVSHMTELALTEAITPGEDAQSRKKESAPEFSEDSKFFKSEESKDNLSESVAGFFFGKNINEGLTANQNAALDNNRARIEPDQSIDPIIAEPEHEIEFDIKDIGSHFSTASTDSARVKDEPEISVTRDESVPALEFTLNLEADQVDKQQESSPDERGIPFSIDFSDDMKVLSASVTPLAEEARPLSLQDDDQPLNKFNLSDIKLELDDEPEKTSEDVARAEDVSMTWDEVAVKIDLAKAYLEMDDKEGAREILEEVIREGNEGQQITAKSMLEDLK